MSDELAEQWQQADEEVRKNLPPGVKLVRTLRGHTGWIGRIAWSPNGRMLASPSVDKTIRLWDAETGICLKTLEEHTQTVISVAFDPAGHFLASGSHDFMVKLWDLRTLPMKDGFIAKSVLTLDADSAVLSVAFDRSGSILASGCMDGKIKLWNIEHGQLLSTLKENSKSVWCISFNQQNMLASGGDDKFIRLWETNTWQLVRILSGHRDGIGALAFDLQGEIIASGADDLTIKLWETSSGKLLRSLEGHIDVVTCVAFQESKNILASKGRDDSIRLWDSATGECLSVIPECTGNRWFPGLAFHPYLPLFATVGSDPGTSINERDCVIHVYELELSVLARNVSKKSNAYTSAKIVLVGDSGVGKTGLGWRLAHGEFKEHSSTHGQQFWVLKQLNQQRHDGAQCEAVLWDLAGQDDYRLIHALFLDDADLALLLFDPTRDDDSLDAVEFWLKQLKADASTPSKKPTLLIAARTDRGTSRLTEEDLQAFCQQRGIIAYLSTSAKENKGINELLKKMQDIIPWNDKSATITTQTFKQIKDFSLDLKENRRRRKVILTPKELRQRLEKTDRNRKFSDAEILTSIGHLANHGYVTRLKTSVGELRILFTPELLNNLAASFVLMARRNQKGLGSLEEQKLLSNDYRFPELRKLTDEEKDILLDSAVVLFLEHNVCFRETDPLNGRVYLVFPELINLKKPLIGNDIITEDGVAYTVSGAVENVYASLVVLMGYTQTFIRTNQWRDHARYEVGTGHVCGFRLEAERAGELDFVLYYGTNTPTPVRTLFQSLFETFLARRNLTVQRYEPVVCPKGHTLNRAVIREQMSSGAEFTFCSRCGDKIVLPKSDKPIQLTERQAKEVEANRRAADQRSRFEQALFRLKNYVTEQKITVPECFISYAWGIPEQERWVEQRLATDLQKAGVTVVLDRWENARIGASVTRFVERVAETNRVIVVGTPLYRKKYENKDTMQGFVVAAEGDLIGKRMIGTEVEKDSVLPVLLEGTKKSAFPPLLHGRVYADFRKREAYFDKMFELLLSIFQLPPNHPVATELRESLVGQRER